MTEVNPPDTGAQSGARGCSRKASRTPEMAALSAICCWRHYGGGSGYGCGGGDIDVVSRDIGVDVQISPLPDAFREHGLNRYTANCPDCKDQAIELTGPDVSHKWKFEDADYAECVKCGTLRDLHPAGRYVTRMATCTHARPPVRLSHLSIKKVTPNEAP